MVVQALLDNLTGRGLDPTVPRLFIVDGAKALSRAIRNTFGVAAAIQRCKIHKGRNIIENALGTVRHVSRNVKRWRSGEMALRWTAAGMLEANKTFRRPKAYRQLPILRKALEDQMRQAQDGSALETIMQAT